MTEFDAKREQFARRLEELKSGSDLEAPAGPDLEQRLRRWEATLDQRLAEHRSEVISGADNPSALPVEVEEPAPPELRPRPHRPFARQDASLRAWLGDLERMMKEELELGNYPLPEGFCRPVQVVDSDQEMRQAIAAACEWDDPERLPVDEHSLGAFHAPGQGTLLNRQHYTQLHGLQNLEQGEPNAIAHMIGEVACQRWGWGYWLEYTALGRQASVAGLWPTLLRLRLGLPPINQRAGDLAAGLRQIWTLTESGWLDWVWQYVMFKARNPVGERLFQRPRPGRAFELLFKIVDLFPLYIAPFGVRLRLRNLFDLAKFLFLEEGDIVPRTLNSVLVAVQEFCQQRDGEVARAIGQPLSQFLGRLYFADLEGHVGILSTPYAVLIAGHLPNLDLDKLQAHELLERVASEPRLNPDTRLAMLAKLDARVKYDPRAMFTAAWERLKLDGPREYFS